MNINSLSEHRTRTESGLLLRPCRHQVAGHLFEEGKAGSLVDDAGHFYKPLQVGPRGNRELAFYELVKDESSKYTPDLAAELARLHPFGPQQLPQPQRRHSISEGTQPKQSIATAAGPQGRPDGGDGLLRGNATVTRRDKIEAWPKSPSKPDSLMQAPLPAGPSRMTKNCSVSSIASSSTQSHHELLRMDSWRPEHDELVSSPAMISRARKVAGSCAGSWGSDSGSAAFAALLRPPASTLLKGRPPHPAVGQGPRPTPTSVGQGPRSANPSGEAHDLDIAAPVAHAEATAMAAAAARAIHSAAAASSSDAKPSTHAEDETDLARLVSDDQSAKGHEYHGGMERASDRGSAANLKCPQGTESSPAVNSQQACAAISDTSNGIPVVIIREGSSASEDSEAKNDGARSGTEGAGMVAAASVQHPPSPAGSPTISCSSRGEPGLSDNGTSPAARDPQSIEGEQQPISAVVPQEQQQRSNWEMQAMPSQGNYHGEVLAASSQQRRSNNNPEQLGQTGAPVSPSSADASAAEAAATATPAGTAAAAVGARVVVEQAAAVQSHSQALQIAAVASANASRQVHGELGQALQRQAFADQASLQAAAGCSSGGQTYAMPYHKDASFVLRNAPMLRAIPRFYGTVCSGDNVLVELEDVARLYKRPSIIDIKIGFKTWYPGGGERYIDKCKVKDASTTQSKLGFKICGMQVFRHLQRGFWRASKRWCKGMSEDAVTKALLRFANNEAGLTPKDIYGGPRGAIAQLAGLTAWFAQQTEFCFYSSSVLIIYEGAATTADGAAVSIRLVDFAHTFTSNGQPDGNFLAGSRALLGALSGVLALDSYDI